MEFYKDTFGFDIEPIPESQGQEYKISVNG